MDNVTRAKKIKLLIFDVDGVLTSGQLVFSHEGEVLKKFHSQDGLGISLAHKAGIQTAIITGRKTAMVNLRGAELKIADIYQGAVNKVDALLALTTKYNLTLEQVGYVGDDLNDLPALVRVGLACAVANAVPEVKARAHVVAAREGGRGAVREIIEIILKAQGKWEAIIASYTEGQELEIIQ
jgi:3-deoxy-D-manno-octulosonate 8-phosphate phosphatase (KDO 8-P phosphatase)